MRKVFSINFLVLFVLMLSVSGCVSGEHYTSGTGGTADQYNSGALAKDWRTQMKKYQGEAYPFDNDNDYYVPKPKKPYPPQAQRSQQKPKPQQQYSNPYDYEEETYSPSGGYRYPRYDSDADNESYNYPMYLDQ